MSKSRRTINKNLESRIIFINDNSLNLYPGTNTEVIYRCDKCDYEIEIFNENLVLSWQMHVQETYHLEVIDLEQKLEREKSEKETKENNANGGKRIRRRNKNTTDDESEERWSRRRVLMLNETNYSDEYKNLSQPKTCKKSDVMMIFDMFPSVDLINNWGYHEVMKAEKEKLKDQRRKIILECLENIIKTFYPYNFTLKLFGSRVTGLATETTNDMDVFIDTDGVLTNDEYAQDEFLTKLVKIFQMCQGKRTSRKSKKKLKNNNELAKLFDADGYPLYGTWGSIVYIKNTRTPIIKARNKKCDMSCDVSVKSGLSVINTELLKSLFHHLPIMRQIILILRIWFKNWSWSKKFTNYAISLMTLFYLQNENILPSIHDINKKCVKLKNETGWPTYDYSTHEEFKTLKMNQEKMSLTEYLFKFFKFYCKFNYETDAICPYMGYSVKRLDFQNNGVGLPTEMVDYKTFVSNPDNEECLYDTAIILQDPIEQCHNITRNIQKHDIQKFKIMAELTTLALGDRVLKTATLL